jgi:hypothetical protein
VQGGVSLRLSAEGEGLGMSREQGEKGSVGWTA